MTGADYDAGVTPAPVPPRKPALWTWRLPLRVWAVLGLVVLAGCGWYLRYESSSGGECGVCLRWCSSKEYGLDLFGKDQVALFETVDWGAESVISANLFPAGHEHDPQYFSSNYTSRFSEIIGCGYPIMAPLAERFTEDLDFRERVVGAVEKKQFSAERAARVLAVSEDFPYPADKAVMRDALELLRACYGDDWDDVEVEGPASWVLEDAEFLLDPEWMDE